ncbi:MAG: nucleotidyltransferase domain-containing protein [Aquincola sp.]|nr:nucleotidyltransferase domain-containing protein [Aquincola sp.]
MSQPIVEALFGSGAKSKVISHLYLCSPGGESLPARALARDADVAYGSINKTLQELAKAQLVVREETSRGPLYRAPFEDPRLAGLFLLVRQDSAIVRQLQRALRSHKGVAYAGVFGSFASGKTQRHSDIDVLVLEQPGIDRFAVMTALAKAADKIKRPVAPQFYALGEFGDKLDRLDPVALSILANPRIDLKGALPWQQS